MGFQGQKVISKEISKMFAVFSQISGKRNVKNEIAEYFF
jgi:hypothetical protein